MSVTADQGQATGQASGLDFDNSLWMFRGNVKITMDQGQLTADEAEINFAKKLLAKAVANGKPGANSSSACVEDRQARATARPTRIDYDARPRAWCVCSKNAWLSDGQNEIRGESLKYNVLAQSIVAEAAEQGSQRVHIIITPPPRPSHERAARAQPRQELQVAAGASRICRSRSRAARWSACSGRTAPARPPLST